MSFDKARADNLLNSITKEPGSGRIDAWSNDLVKEFHRGYPLTNLRPLLLSSDPKLVSAATWIASELGEKGKALLRDVSALLQHPEKDVRFDAINCLLAWADASNGTELASVIKLMDDPERSVRWKVMDFLARGSEEQLRSTLSELQIAEPTSVRTRGLEWLLSPEAGNSESVVTALDSQDPVFRKFGAVAARRLSKRNKAPLLHATTVDDADIKNFADSGLKIL